LDGASDNPYKGEPVFSIHHAVAHTKWTDYYLIIWPRKTSYNTHTKDRKPETLMGKEKSCGKSEGTPWEKPQRSRDFPITLLKRLQKFKSFWIMGNYPQRKVMEADGRSQNLCHMAI